MSEHMSDPKKAEWQMPVPDADFQALQDDADAYVGEIASNVEAEKKQRALDLDHYMQQVAFFDVKTLGAEFNKLTEMQGTGVEPDELILQKLAIVQAEIEKRPESKPQKAA